MESSIETINKEEGKTFLQELSTGNATKRLAILADMLSVIGISIIAVLSPLFSGVSRNSLERLFALAFFACFLLTALCLIMAMVLGVTGRISRRTSINREIKICLLISLWSGFCFIFLSAIGLYVQKLILQNNGHLQLVVEVSTNLTAPEWVQLQNSTLTNGSIYFTDPQGTKYSQRFYRIRSP
jgi:hypothetical protein